MKYFKNENNQIFAYDDEQIKKGYGDNLTSITEDEKDTILAPSHEEIEKQRISSIKAKAEQLITAKYSIIWQLNHPRLDESYKDDYAYIDRIRDISNEAETKGTKLEDINWGV